MAYTVTDGGAGIDKPLDNSFVTRSELYAILDQLKESNKFYEFEPFEVLRISGSRLEQTDDTEKKTFQRIQNDLLPGEVLGRYVFSEQGDDIEELEGRTFLPLNSNIIQYPLRGELWLGMSYKGQQYYIARLSENIEDINFSKFNESSLTSGTTDDFSRAGSGNLGQRFVDLLPKPAPYKAGDTLLQGRFGNYIRLSSDNNGVRNTEGGNIPSSKIVINNSDIVNPNSFYGIAIENFTKENNIIVIKSDRLSFNANNTADFNAKKDIRIRSNEGNVRIEAEDTISLKPENSKIEFDVADSKNGQIINITKPGIPFPDLNMAGFLKQTMGIQKVFQGLTFGVPKLSNPLTLASGVKDIVKGLEGAKNFVEATLNLEFLEKEVLTTKTIGEIKASLPIPAGLLNVVGSIDDFADDVEGTLKKVDDFKKDNEEKFKQAAELSSAIDNLVPTGIARVLEEIPADELSQIPGAQDVLDVVSSEGSTLGGIKIKDLTENDIANAREFGVFGDLEDYVAEQGSIQQDIEQAKFIGKILNLTKQEQ